ncbi:cytochrome c biogenesis protein CcsA [Ureibacillus manganicus]|uniref:Cytochrome C assembly protein n=1 Tax=Ureibacillus manganicus DSM 26584 TaxID=1384049 RepID=A0A0A3I574_9BACL|nr:cytochrome c biogenesis protein CcsA [Ureibacillus manganicus]KGR78670.1 cytochrome C assembly protein [Ureibacillus manganicus DSM 26584]
MIDLTMSRIYEIMVLLYAISIVLYFIDYFYRKVQIRRVAFWLVSIVWVMQTVFFLLYIIEMKRFPVLTLIEGVYFYAWLLITISIILHCIVRVDLPVFFINILGFIFVTIHLFAPDYVQHPLRETLVSEMLIIHISFAILSYASFTLAFVFSVLYLILYKLLKGKKYTKLWSRLPSLQQLSKWVNGSILIGNPIFLISIILGLEWAFLTLEGLSIIDAKIIGSFIIFVIYFTILILHQKGKLSGINYSWAQIYTFLLVVVNFFLGSKLSSFHLWY